MSEPWFDETGITITKSADLLREAKRPQFGETGAKPLTAFLLCEAFEHRFDPAHARALHLAAMIISRAVALTDKEEPR